VFTIPIQVFTIRRSRCSRWSETRNRYGTRLLLRVDDESVCSVPPQWTDSVAPDPEVVMGEERAVARVADLVELTRLVARLSRRGDTR